MAQMKKYNHTIWRFLADFWAITTMVLFIYEIFVMRKSDTFANLGSIFYIAILSIYAGNKEFRRWKHEHFASLHWGEAFVLYWTVLIFMVIAWSVWSHFKLPDGLAATYIAVISIFALTSRSKIIYHNRKIKRSRR